MAPASVYIGGLPDATTRSELHDHLSIYGRVNALNIQKGYTFVEFESEKDALDFVETFSKQPLLGTACKVEVAKHPRRNPKSSTSPRSSELASESHPYRSHEGNRVRYPVVVQNLNPQTCWQELKDFGRRFGGTVAYCDIDRNNRRRGFLEYYTQKDADKVVQKLDGETLLGHRVTLSSHGRQMLREEHTRSRSRSPVQRRDREREREHRGVHAHRSRSPSKISSRHSGSGKSPYSPRRHSQSETPASGAKNLFHTLRETDNSYVSHREGPRHVAFSHSSDRGLFKGREILSRSMVVGKNIDPSDDLAFASDERKKQMERVEEEWLAYSHVPPV